MLNNPLFPLVAVLYAGMGALLLTPTPDSAPTPTPTPISSRSAVDAGLPQVAGYIDSLPPSAAGPAVTLDPGTQGHPDSGLGNDGWWIIATREPAGFGGALGTGLKSNQADLPDSGQPTISSRTRTRRSAHGGRRPGSAQLHG